MGITFSLRRPQGSASPDLLISEDDYSVRVTHVADRRFWLRMEKHPGAELVVSDCAAGQADAATLAAACRLAVRRLGAMRPSRVVFRDVVAGGHQTADFPVKMLMAGQLAKQLAASIAAEAGRRPGCLALTPRRGRLDAVVGLE